MCVSLSALRAARAGVLNDKLVAQTVTQGGKGGFESEDSSFLTVVCGRGAVSDWMLSVDAADGRGWWLGLRCSESCQPALLMCSRSLSSVRSSVYASRAFCVPPAALLLMQSSHMLAGAAAAGGGRQRLAAKLFHARDIRHRYEQGGKVESTGGAAS